MLFNSYEFIFLFLPVSLIIFFTLAKHNQTLSTLWIILASLFFYGYWNVKYIPLLLASVLVNYFVSMEIQHTRAKKLWLVSGIIFNFLLLGYFKYTGFFLNTLNSLTGSNIFMPRIILPLGISFFTFTQVSYITEIYRGSVKDLSLLKYCEYVTFFPYITSGPIANCKDMLPQLSDTKNFMPNYENLAAGITLFMLGLFKKAYIADGFAMFVNNLFANVNMLTFFEAWSAALGYSFQLYFDFSGYSDMAVGLGLMFNVRLPENFNSPYKSLSVIDFWRRWHISLGAWIRDYIYIPLGGSREGELKRARNVMLAMLFCGLWHGAGWTFILWGGLHGAFLVVNHAWRKLRIKLPVFLSWLITFVCVIVGWVVFRAESFGDAAGIISKMFNFRNIEIHYRFQQWLGFLEAYGFKFTASVEPATSFTLHLIYILAVMFIVLALPNTQQIMTRFKPRKLYLVIVIVIAVMSFMNFSGISDFLYFQF